MKQISLGIVGTGWCGGIRAETSARNPLVKSLHVAEIKPERLAEVARATGARTATADYRELLALDDLDAVMISAAPETTHYRTWHGKCSGSKPRPARIEEVKTSDEVEGSPGIRGEAS